jgi:hypothetical protein
MTAADLAKDPIIAGLAFAATRDLVTFLRYLALHSSHSLEPAV